MIYSIYYISVITDVQEIGKLKALGASVRQVRSEIFFRQSVGDGCTVGNAVIAYIQIGDISLGDETADRKFTGLNQTFAARPDDHAGRRQTDIRRSAI